MTSQRRGEETRTRILDAAAERFARSGYDATGVAEICQRAGVTKGAFYHHFPSKQDVFLELLNRWLEGLDTQFQVARGEADTVPRALLAMARMAGQVFEAARGQLPMFLEFWTKAARDPAVWQATIAPYRRYRAVFVEMIETGVAEGSLGPCDPRTVAQVMVSLAVGLVLQELMDPEGTDCGRVAEDGVRMLLRGLNCPEEEIQ
jgi:AcrR family transcriptional regulator